MRRTKINVTVPATLASLVPTKNRRGVMTIKRVLGTCAVTMAATVSAAAIWFAGAGTALAPSLRG